uniref:Uncharacterized protein n=1 Tax=Calcidiscus leptoporus TaxID=127549 RepID=A0A7S0J9H9_9EUKA|mmetsp:Transcript_46179/g.107607  ORF Transcript_46179/g.107607 Transcript_46179/m.107607 type:complete len:272 (+) Transcript_46179:23-838(+)
MLSLQPSLAPLHVPSLSAASARSGVPFAVLPKALIPIIFIPWGVPIGYAFERRFGVEAGPFTRFVKSDAVQKGGPTMRRIDKSLPSKVKGVRLTPPARDVTRTFRKEYPTKELELLWGALIKCYGNQERALEAINANPQMLNPSYSFPNTLLESKQVLLSVMSQAEALEVMRLNPAVLQCGPSLGVLGATEIMAIARLRSLGNTLIPPQLRSLAVGVLFFCLALVVTASRAEDPEVLALVTVLRPLLGLGLASIFLFVVYGAANAGRSASS